MFKTTPPFQDIAAFIAVAESSSFTKAGELLETGKSNVGKAVQRLEGRLRVKLLQRTTRTVRLTEDGLLYLDAARAALSKLSEAEDALAERLSQPAGTVRLDLPVSLGSAVTSSLPRFLDAYPKVRLEISLNDRMSNPVKDGWDLVVRIGDLSAAGGMTVRRLSQVQYGLFASPRYLRDRGPIQSIQDLHGLDGVIYRENSGQLRAWSVSVGDREEHVLPNVAIVAHDGRTMIDAALAGLGVAQLFDRVAAAFMASGELVQILPDHVAPPLPVHALIPAGARMPPKTRAVLEHLGRVLLGLSR